MVYKISLKPSVKKELDRLSKRDQRRIYGALALISHDPFIGKKLQGEYRGLYSFRSWPYRIIYTILRKELLIIIVKIGHRQGAY